jgi:predicted nucleic acid-binding protein
MKVFIDANVLVTVLNKEYPLFATAARILSIHGKRGFTLYSSPVCLAIAYYFAEKKHGYQRAKEKMAILCDHILIAETGDLAVRKALAHKAIKDFEDGLEYYAAKEQGCHYIVTEDRDDFYFSDIPVMNCALFFNKVVLENT